MAQTQIEQIEKQTANRIDNSLQWAIPFVQNNERWAQEWRENESFPSQSENDEEFGMRVSRKQSIWRFLISSKHLPD